MSGIAGLVQFENHGHDLKGLVEIMTDCIAHRGPEGAAFSIPAQNQLCLGQRNFQKNEKGKSPLYPCQIDEGNLILLIDGHVYNAKEVKALLEKEGQFFESADDGEIILRSYKYWGMDCLNYFNGNWAMLIYDRLKNRLFASRDRVGGKPFYYYKDGQYFAFASEAKALLKLPFVRRSMNPAAVFDLFFQNKYEAKANFFENIRELQPAHYLLLDMEAEAVKTERYYRLPVNTECPGFDENLFQEYSSRINLLLEKAVGRQIAMEEPASLLSGGLDSSILTFLAKNISGKAPKVFTSCFESELFDEQKWASVVVSHTGAQWFKTYPKLPELIDDLETLAYCQDTPLTSAGTYSQFRSMQLAKANNARIVFDGQGADALFAGQLPHHAALWRTFYKNWKIKELYREMGALGSMRQGILFYTKMLLKNAYFPRLGRTLKHSIQKQYFRELHYFNPDFVEKHFHRYDLYREDHMKSLNHQLYREYFCGGLKYLLKCVDRSSMWHSVQARTPYSDDLALMEYVFNIPASYKIRNATGKILLREAFRKFLPVEIVERRDKKALATPNNEWIMSMRDVVFPYFEALDGAVFNKKQLLQDFHRFFYLDSPLENYRLFKYIGLAVWRKVFGV